MVSATPTRRRNLLPSALRLAGLFALTVLLGILAGHALRSARRTAARAEPVATAASSPPGIARTSTGVAGAEREVAPRSDLTSGERHTIDLFRRASPSVVYITNLGVRRDPWSANVFEVPQGTGSGFLWDDRGHVVTNYHVIRGARRAEVTLQDQTSYDAELVGVAEDKDLAVLRVDAPRDRLTPLPIGTSADLLVGQSVYAIGNPFGLDYTLTTGIISALGREIQSLSGRPIQGVVQTDAAINPGNSGGPLLDSSGRLIGVNTSIVSPSGAYAGVGFAVPVDTVNRIVPQLIRSGRVERVGLGIVPIEDHYARRLGIAGVIVRNAPGGSAAARAGLRGISRDERGRPVLGDVIVAVDGRKVESLDDLYRALDGRTSGDRVEVTVEREGRHETIAVILQPLD